MAFAGHSLRQSGPCAPLAASRPRPARRLAARLQVQSLVLAEADAVTDGAEPQASSSGEQAPQLLPRPSKPVVIWRAPPSPRTVAGKERSVAEHQAAVAVARAEARAARNGSDASTSGPAPLNRPGRPPPRPGRFPERGPPAGARSSGSGGYQQQPQRNQPTTGPARAAIPSDGRASPAGVTGGKGGSAGRDQGGRGDPKKTSRGGRRKQQAEDKIDVDRRRKSRQTRRAEREEERRSNRAVKEEIFEVGPEGMGVVDLAAMLAAPTSSIVKLLFLKGVMVQVNSTLDSETVKAVALEFGVEVLDRDQNRSDMARKSVDFIDEDDLEHLQPRPPVVTVMGHVDHGKTSLLDFIRKTRVAAGEAGGITQAIGAYTCPVNYLGEPRQVTFLDTPGHEAFSAMRARGARVTDIAIIIVAADDGCQPQTVEAICHAKAAGVPIVVAINKVDKEGANVERVKQQLTEHELVPEEWGGKTPMVAISAKKGQGVDELLETVLLVAELEEVQANPTRSARGTVLEAGLDKKAGAVASLLVQNGTLRVGDAVQAGGCYGRVRSMRSSAGDVATAEPSIAVQMLGLNSPPAAGDEFTVFASEAEARGAAEAIEDARRLERLAELAGGGSMVTLSSLASVDDDEGHQSLQRLNIILKADTSGSIEAVRAALGALPQDTVMLRYLMASPGEVSISDIDLAVASSGTILGFNVAPSDAVAAAAKSKGLTINTYNVIYSLVDDVRAAMEGRLKSVEERVAIGQAEVKAVFGSSSRKVAGCLVTDGLLRKDCVIQVFRGRRMVHDGTLSSLRRVKDDVREVPAGTECGVSSEDFRDWEEGDRIEAFELVRKRLRLEEAHATHVTL